MKKDDEKKKEERKILKIFLKLFNKTYNTCFKLKEQIPQTKANGPDFIIEDFKDKTVIGVELTKLFDFPSTQTKKQINLEKEFKKILNKLIDKNKYEKYSFCIYPTEYPSNYNKLKKHAEDIIEKIEYLYSTNELRDARKIIINGQLIRIIYNPCKKSNELFIFYSHNFGRISELDEINFYKALKERINNKITKFKNYIKKYPIYLILYNSSKHSIFLSYKEILSKKSLYLPKQTPYKNIFLFNDIGLLKLK